MSESVVDFRKLLTFAALAIGSTGFCLLCGSYLSRWATNTDDGWRRTDLGWERVAYWNEPAMATAMVPAFHGPAPAPPKTVLRWDSHPAALALVQLAVACFSLFAMPTPSQLVESRLLVRLPGLIAKSFRASPFG